MLVEVQFQFMCRFFVVVVASVVVDFIVVWHVVLVSWEHTVVRRWLSTVIVHVGDRRWCLSIVVVNVEIVVVNVECRRRWEQWKTTTSLSSIVSSLCLLSFVVDIVVVVVAVGVCNG